MVSTKILKETALVNRTDTNKTPKGEKNDTATLQMLFQDALRFSGDIATGIVTKGNCAIYQKDDSCGVKAD